MQELSAQRNRRCVCVREKSVFDDNACTAVDFEALDEVLQEQVSGFPGFDREVFLDGVKLFATEWWIGKHHVVSIAFLDL